MRNPFSGLPIGVWLGFVIIGLGAWARDIFGVAVGGILAVVTLIMTDRQKAEEAANQGETDDDIAQDERFKDL